jgi:crossover junction endodeoxyribonuclease RuvC
MFEPCVLGVDPGIAATGIAVVCRRDRRAEILWADTIRTPSDLAEAARLRFIHDHVRQAIAAHRPGSVAIERVAWNKNAVSALRVARATGVIMVAAAEAGLAVEEYGPLEVKMAVTGSGTADKAQVREALARFHGLAEVPSQPDAADAVAIALCHLTQSRVRRAARAVALR